jgi:hypothetical protein
VEQKALELEYFIRKYVPDSWKEPIETIMFVPWVSVRDIKQILSGIIPRIFDKFPFNEAIKTWLELKCR